MWKRLFGKVLPFLVEEAIQEVTVSDSDDTIFDGNIGARLGEVVTGDDPDDDDDTREERRERRDRGR